MIKYFWEIYKNEAENTDMPFEVFEATIKIALRTKQDIEEAKAVMQTFSPDNFTVEKQTTFIDYLLTKGIKRCQEANNE